MLRGYEAAAQQCGASAEQIQYQHPEQSADGPYAVRLYIYILRQSNGSGGLSSSELSLVLNQLDQDFTPHNIRFSVACIEDVPNSVLYNDPALTRGSSIGQNITDGICLFLAKKLSAGLAGSADVGGSRAWAALLSDAHRRVPSHELGHSLSLYHTFRGSKCTDEDNDGGDPFGNPDTTGDEISDTSPEPGEYPAPPAGCEDWASIAPVDCGSQIFIQSPGPNVLHNIMSYAERLCTDRFTLKQGERMRNHIQMNKLNMVVQDGWVKADATISGADRYYNTDIIISAGTLTISGKVHMAKGKKIVVEPGAIIKMTTTGHLTNWPQGTCANQFSGLWAGIDLRTSNTATVPATASFTGGTIENADAALHFNMDGLMLSTPQPIVSATTTTFRNNVAAVYFFSDSRTNSNYNEGKRNLFNGCNFIIDGGFEGGAFLQMVTLVHPFNTHFRSCYFSNEIQHTFPPAMETFGIKALNAKLIVEKGNASGGTIGVFEGLTHGIAVFEEGSSSYPLTITGCTFQQAKYGIRTEGVNGATITGNTFYTGSTLYGSTFQYGLYVNTGTGYTIQENHFYGVNVGFSSLARGLYVNNSGSESNLIKENDFHWAGLRRGILVEGQNQNKADKKIGLSLLCNELSDLSIPFGTNIHVQGGATLATHQGSPGNPAGNEFSHTYLDYDNGGPDLLNYYYYTADPKQNPSAGANSSKINRIGSPISPTCTPDFTGGGGEDLAGLDSKYADLQAAYTAALNDFHALIDGGNTASLLANVQVANAAGAAQLKNTLLGLSPYLSETVLAAAFNRSDIFSTENRHDLLWANPDVLKSGDFMAAVYGSGQPLSAAQLQSLEQARYTTTARTDAEAAIGDLHQQKSAIVRQVVHILYSDSVSQYPTLRTWWSRNNGFESNLLIADSYLAEQNTASWQQQVNAMSSGSLTTEQATDLTNYTAFRQIMLTAAAEGRHDDDLNAAEVAQVEAIALANNRYVSQTAKNLLTWFYGYSFGGGEAERPSEEEEAATAGVSEKAAAGQAVLFRVYPNPADREVVFERDGKPTGGEEYTLSIFDAFGQRVALRSISGSQIRLPVGTEGLRSGLYYYSLNNGSVNRQTGKFIVR